MASFDNRPVNWPIRRYLSRPWENRLIHLRQFITPPLVTGFVRNGRYTVQCDSLRIKFVLRDVQKLQQPALPLIKCEGTFTRTCTTERNG